MKEYLVLLNNQKPISLRASMVVFQQHLEKVVVTFKNDQGTPIAEFSKEHFVGYCEKNMLTPEESKPQHDLTHYTNGNGHYNGNGNGNGHHKHFDSIENTAINNLAHIMHELEMEPDFN